MGDRFALQVQIGSAVDPSGIAGIALTVEVAASAAVDLSVLHLEIDEIGAAFTLGFDFGAQGLELTAPELRFIPPKGMAASLDLGGFGGSGFLTDLGGGEWGGGFSIDLGPVTVVGLGLLHPDPFSLLVLLAVELTPPIQLSFGFSLDRVGGLVGLDRTVDAQALRQALRGGVAGNALFPAGIEQSKAALPALRSFFPALAGHDVVGPSLRLSWLSFGEAGSLVSLDMAVILELPTATIAVVGVARVGIPGLPGLIDLRLDVLGIIDPVHQMVSIDLSLVDSHVLGIFSVYGDAAARFSWGSQAYVVVTIGGFFPGFDPEPAQLPALRRVGLSVDVPVPGFDLHVEGYFAVTTNTIQFGGRLEASVGLGITAHGFLAVDAIVQFRPFHFQARCSAGFEVEVAGFSFAGVSFDGAIAGPGPVTIHGTITIETFLFDVSWDQTFTIGSGPGDTTPPPVSLLHVLGEELAKAENLHTNSLQDSAVVLQPRALRPGVAAVPPAGSLRWSQHRAPLGFPIDRLDGHPLGSPQGVRTTGMGSDVADRFSPGSYCTLTQSEAISRPPFDILASGAEVVAADASGQTVDDPRTVDVIVVHGPVKAPPIPSSLVVDLGPAALLVTAARSAPSVSDPVGAIVATHEGWVVVSGVAPAARFANATAAHQSGRGVGVAVAEADAAQAVDLVGV